MIKAKKLYAWDWSPAPAEPDECEATSSARSSSTGESVGGLFTISGSAVLIQDVKEINEMTITTESFTRESWNQDQ